MYPKQLRSNIFLFSVYICSQVKLQYQTPTKKVHLKGTERIKPKYLPPYSTVVKNITSDIFGNDRPIQRHIALQKPSNCLGYRLWKKEWIQINLPGKITLL